MTTSVLDLLPPDARITGYLGDSRCYWRFDCDAGTTLTDLKAICERFQSAYQDVEVKAYRLCDREATKVEIPEFPGLTLYLDVECPEPNKWGHVLNDPWVITRVEYIEPGNPSYNEWSHPSRAASRASDFFLRMGAFLATLTTLEAL